MPSSLQTPAPRSIPNFRIALSHVRPTMWPGPRVWGLLYAGLPMSSHLAVYSAYVASGSVRRQSSMRWPLRGASAFM